MKSSYLALIITFAGAGVQAQSIGYSSELYFDNGDGASVTTVFHATGKGCEAARERVRESAADAGKLIGASSCRRAAYPGGKYVAAALAQVDNSFAGVDVGYTPHPDPWPIPWPRPWPWPWPWPGPWCLSCPPPGVFDYDQLVKINPAVAEQVAVITKQFQLDEYAARLKDLQAQFDLQGAENALYGVQVNLQRQALER